jgi:hypothetical protein
MPFPQGHIDVVPNLTERVGDGTGSIRWPRAGTAVVRIRPDEDLSFGQRGEVLDVPDPPAFVQQLGQGRVARKTTQTIAQRVVQFPPILAKGFG